MNQEVRQLFHELADLSPAERERFLADHQVGAEVRAEVESLLAFDSGQDQSLTNCVSGAASEILRSGGYTAQCGPYRLVRLLGSGGMGAVYLAARTDGEIQQQVAIKFLRADSDRSAWRDRFLQERQVLASLNHASIVHVLDAGHTDVGRPYLVMEYVKGLPIDQYAANLSMRDRLKLFLKVCEGVSHAHQHLIIHRDLKPSNILVDAFGQPKLLDFGIAKILQPGQSPEVERTATVLQALTPQYASPEQVRGEAITTGTDVYSLGVLLYRLLTDRLPYEFPNSTPSAIKHAVSEAEPAPPRISGDLDNILLMALRKDPAWRYLSVQHLADDIERALTDRPVSARPDTLRYRAAKFIRRNRFSSSAAVVAVAAILAGSAVALYQGRVAQQRFEQVRKLAHTFVFDLHDAIAGLEGSTKAREMMVRTGLEYLDNLARNAGGDLQLQNEIAAAYLKIGDAQGYPTKPNLGRIRDALTSYRKAGDIYRRIAAKNDVYLPGLATYYLQYAGLIRLTGDLKQSRELSESAIQVFDQVRAHQPFQSQWDYMGAWCTLGDVDEDLGQYQRAWTEFSRCRQLAYGQLKSGRSQRALSVVSQATERVGTVAQELGRLQDALQAFDEDQAALDELLRAKPGNPAFHRRQAILHQFRSRLYYDNTYPNLGDPARALQSAQRYLAEAEKMVRADPNNTSAQISQAIAMGRVSLSLREFDAGAAVRMARDSVQRFDDLIASGTTSDLIISNRALALYRLGSTVEGRPPRRGAALG